MKIKQSLILWLPVILWMGVIFAFSAMPTVETSKIYWWDFVIKKTAHIIEYAILYFLVYRAITQEFRIKNFKYVLCSMFYVLFYAFSDEFHQRFVPGRHSKLRDVGFDFIGMLIALLIIKKGQSLKLEIRN